MAGRKVSFNHDNKWHAAAVKTLYYGVYMPMCSPLLLCAYVAGIPERLRDRKLRNSPEWRRVREIETLFCQQRITDKPPKLPVVRPRALSSTSGVQQQTTDQCNSFLLAKLPIELRTEIWGLVLGSYTIEIFRGHGRLLHRLKENYIENLESALTVPDLYSDPSRDNLLSLLKTCRQVYTETIEILYSENKFSLWQNDTIFYFRSIILPHRFSAINSLTLHWQFRDPNAFEPGRRRMDVSPPGDAATWQEACQILKAMTSLKELTVIVRGPFIFSQGIQIDEQRYHSGLLGMLLPLSEIRVIEKEAFRVRVPWAWRKVGTRQEEMRLLDERHKFPFTMVHPKEEVPDEEEGPELIEY